MKVLSMHMNFQLPDDFEGDLNDALEELVKYRKDKGLTNPTEDPTPEYNEEENKILNSAVDIAWHHFWLNIKDGVHKFHGHLSIGELMPDNTWRKIRK